MGRGLGKQGVLSSLGQQVFCRALWYPQCRGRKPIPMVEAERSDWPQLLEETLPCCNPQATLCPKARRQAGLSLALSTVWAHIGLYDGHHTAAPTAALRPGTPSIPPQSCDQLVCTPSLSVLSTKARALAMMRLTVSKPQPPPRHLGKQGRRSELAEQVGPPDPDLHGAPSRAPSFCGFSPHPPGLPPPVLPVPCLLIHGSALWFPHSVAAHLAP